MGTGKENKVVITASSNLSEAEIERAVKEAEAHAEEDKKIKEKIEVKNNADSLVYNTEKTLKDLGDKVSAEEKSAVEAEIANVKKALEGDDVEAIKAAQEKLQQEFYKVSEKLYANVNPNAGAQDAGAANDANANNDTNGTDYKVE